MNSSQLLTITIPSFKQRDFLKRCLESLRRQTWKDFKIIIIDDKSGESFEEILQDFSDLDISFFINNKNLGAIENIINSIFYSVQSKYLLSLHEDDVLVPQYLERAIILLEENQDINFASTIANWFPENSKSENILDLSSLEVPSTYVIEDIKNFTARIIKGSHITFGSIIYRVNELKTTHFDLDHFSTLGDRPLLLNLLKNKKCTAVFTSPHIWVRAHEKNDFRNEKVRSHHILNLFECYSKALSPANIYERRLLEKFATNDLLLMFSILSKKDISLFKMLKNILNTGYFKISKINMKFFAAIFIVIFGQQLFSIFLKIKKV